MFSKENYKSTRNLELNYIKLNEKFASLARKMDFYLTTSGSIFPCFKINWIEQWKTKGGCTKGEMANGEMKFF